MPQLKDCFSELENLSLRILTEVQILDDDIDINASTNYLVSALNSMTVLKKLGLQLGFTDGSSSAFATIAGGVDLPCLCDLTVQNTLIHSRHLKQLMHHHRGVMQRLTMRGLGLEETEPYDFGDFLEEIRVHHKIQMLKLDEIRTPDFHLVTFYGISTITSADSLIPDLLDYVVIYRNGGEVLLEDPITMERDIAKIATLHADG